MLKTYVSHSEISINVMVGGAHVHVAFIPHTLGGSSMSTADPQLQEAIERHRYFGTRITLMPPQTTPVHGASTRQEAKEPQLLTFTSITDAKDYCADTFGVSRTLLRTMQQIIDLAADNGVVIQFK